MNVWKYEIISRVEQDISLVRFAHSWDILVNTWNKFHISAHPCIILYLLDVVNNMWEVPLLCLELDSIIIKVHWKDMGRASGVFVVNIYMLTNLSQLRKYNDFHCAAY